MLSERDHRIKITECMILFIQKKLGKRNDRKHISGRCGIGRRAGVRGGRAESGDYRGVAVAMDMFVVLTVSRVCK